jgi:hypothetical protein
MKKILFSAAVILPVLLFLTVAAAQTTLPSGLVTVYGASKLSDNTIDKDYYIQLYTSSALKDSLVVQFQYKDSSGNWKNIDQSKKIGDLSTGTSPTAKKLLFSPSKIGMRHGISYSFRALVYEGGKLVKTYEGSTFVFKHDSIQTKDASSLKDAAPTISVSRAANPIPGKSFKIVATASDDIGLKRIDIYLDGSLVKYCTTTTKFLLCDWTGGERWAAGTSHSYYAVATDKSDKKTSSETVTIVVGKANEGNILYSVGDPEGEFCKKCVRSGKGYNSDSQACESGTAIRSTESKATAANKNWFFFENVYNVVDAGKKDQLAKIALACEQIGLSVATKSTKLVTGQEPLPDTRRCSDNSYCGTCVAFDQSECGWDTKEKVCRRGSLEGSDDRKATVSDGNWVFFSTIAGRGSSPGKSCEEIDPSAYRGIPVKSLPTSSPSPSLANANNPASTQTTNEIVKKDAEGNIIYVKSGEVEATVIKKQPSTEPPSTEPNALPTAAATESSSVVNLKCASYKTCGECTPSLSDSCGWDISTGTCKRGRQFGSDDKTADIDKGNWVYYTKEKNRGSAKGLSCEGAGLLAKESQSSASSTLPTISTPTSLPQTETVTRDATSNTKTKEDICASYSTCRQCTPIVAESCGWDINENKCKFGTASGSKDEKASVSAKTWVWYTTKARKGEKPGLSCEELEVEINCNKKKSCQQCTPSTSDSCGWDKNAGVCKHGTSAGSDDGRATVSDGNWVWYTTKANRGGKPGLSCDEI